MSKKHPPTKESKRHEPAGFDVEAARARSVAQSEKMIQMVELASDRSIGTWYRLPRGTEQWNYVRCGLKGTEAALAMAYDLRQKGYVEAHPDVRLAGFEADGDRMLIMCAPPETFERVQAMKRKLKQRNMERLKQSFGSDLNGLQQFGSVTVSGSEGVGSVADFTAAANSTKR